LGEKSSKKGEKNSASFCVTEQFAAALKRGYIAVQGEHPHTIGYSLVDSPIGLAAWMLDHDPDSYAKISTGAPRAA
jgi:hypothetical protein